MPRTPASSSRASSRRRVTRALTGALLVIGLGSCASTLKLDEYRSASSELCGLLDQCFDANEPHKCQNQIEKALAASGNDSVASWLGSFADLSCLESCSSARRCLDLPLLCDKTTCSRQEDCCGFSQGLTDCVENPEAQAKACCARSGAPCDELGCCDGAGDCRPSAEDPTQRTCGGTICRPARAACVIGAQCCTGICKDLKCAVRACDPLTFQCSANDECCSKFCDPVSRRCAVPKACIQPGQACSVLDDCCGSTFTCHYEPGASTGTCTDTMCVRDEAECATDNQCCSGHCDPQLFLCGALCNDQSLFCEDGTDCCSGRCEDHACAASCSVGYCTADKDCCTGACLGGVCKPACNPVTSHLACSLGGPLDPQSEGACVQQICEKDAYCCCGGWDAACVLAAKSAGGACACP